MPSLPVLSGRDTVRVFGKLGWQMARQRGSHIILVKSGHNASLSVPDHREIAKAPSAAFCAPRAFRWTNSLMRCDRAGAPPSFFPPPVSVALGEKTLLDWIRLRFPNGQTGWVRKEEVIALWR